MGMITRMLVYVVIMFAGAVITAAIREWLGTEVKHRSWGRGVIHNTISVLITIVGWEVFTWALYGP